MLEKLYKKLMKQKNYLINNKSNIFKFIKREFEKMK